MEKTEEKWHPCSQEQGFCSSMMKRLKFPGEKGYGFFAFMVIDHLNEKRVQEKLKGILYKSETKDHGIMLNYCPFCGEKIDWFRDAREQKPEGESHEVQIQ
jgi:Icc-related predicted phosphoesterase